MANPAVEEATRALGVTVAQRIRVLADAAEIAASDAPDLHTAGELFDAIAKSAALIKNLSHQT
jgi:hypothetical protein